MRTFLALSILTLPSFAGAASAQIVPYGQPYSPYSAADRQRYEMEQVRVRGVEAESLARQQSVETQATLSDLRAQREAARLPSTVATPSVLPRSLEQERATREAATTGPQTTGPQTTVAGVSQIDDWLNRPHH